MPNHARKIEHSARRIRAVADSGLESDLDRVRWASRLKYLMMVGILWDLAIATFGLMFAPPFRGANSLPSLSDSMLRFFYLYESMFFHSMAVPFVAVLVYVTVAILGIRGRVSTLVVTTATAGFILASAGALYLMFDGDNQTAIGALWVGLSLSISSGIVLLGILWPKENGAGLMKLKGVRLVELNIWTAAICLLAAVAVGAYASTGSAQWGADLSFQGFGLVVAAHIHTVITIIDAALVVLIARFFDADTYDGIPGIFVKLGLYGILLGTPTTTLATFVTVPLGVAAHNAVTVFAGILLQASLFIMYAVLFVEARRLKIRSPRGVIENIMIFGLLFIIFWVNVVVTLPGIYVAVNMSRFIGLPNELAFVTGHMHVLITLTAIALIMLIALMYGVQGKLAIIAGTSLTAGYMLSSAATVYYIFLDWNTVNSVYIPYIGVGIALIVVGTLVELTGLAVARGDTLPRVRTSAPAHNER
jgi:hypothetical protein